MSVLSTRIKGRTQSQSFMHFDSHEYLLSHDAGKSCHREGVITQTTNKNRIHVFVFRNVIPFACSKALIKYEVSFGDLYCLYLLHTTGHTEIKNSQEKMYKKNMYCKRLRMVFIFLSTPPPPSPKTTNKQLYIFHIPPPPPHL